MTFPFNIQQLTDSSVKRESCQVCSNAISSKKCESVKNVFSRKYLKNGYHCFDTIPVGACDVNIAQKRRSNNILALRRTTPYFLNGNRIAASYFLNGNWITAKSGNYNVNDDSFAYTSPEQLDKDANITEEIQFSHQLSQAVEACLIRSASLWAF